MFTNKVAVYSTVYNGVEKYLGGWFKSILAQEDLDFDLWIGVDGLKIDELKGIIDEDDTKLSINYILPSGKNTPAQIRQLGITRLIHEYSAIIFVDSDDILYPSRVSSAKKMLEIYDVYGCALKIIQENGNETDVEFRPQNNDLNMILPRYNVLGLSNTAYRTSILRQFPPIPSNCRIVDWYLGTCAWALGAKMVFDPLCRMGYRQYPGNIACILPPFTAKQIISSAELVLEHYSIVLNNIPQLQSMHINTLKESNNIVKLFYKSMLFSKDRLYNYVKALNELPSKHIWWSCIAHPELEEIWKN